MAIKITYKVLLLLLIIGVVSSNAQISVPEYMFKGTEITDFKVEPSYTSFNFKFEAPSSIDLYLTQRKHEISVAEKQDYKTIEPAIIYSNPVGTTLSSLFVGEIAYRNSIVKLFFNNNYIEAIASYERFKDKLEGTEFYDESTLLYGFSLIGMGNREEGVKYLKEIALDINSEYYQVAQDRLFQTAVYAKDYSIFNEFAPTLQKVSPYAVSLWLDYLYDKRDYSNIINVLNSTGIEIEYPEYTALRVIATYYMQQYKDVVQYAEAVQNMPAFAFIIDALIIDGNIEKANELFKTLVASPEWDALKIKLDIANGDYASAIVALQNIKNDDDKLALFFYTISEKFDKAPVDFIAAFTFNNKVNNDYVAFYKGLKELSLGRYSDSITSLSLVAFKRDLMTLAYFYMGMASVYTDTSRAEWNFGRYIGEGKDEEKLMLSKFMLSQLYYQRQQYDEAFLLIDDCGTNYCSILKGDIYLATFEYDKAVDVTEGIDDDRAYLISATGHYNLKRYDNALNDVLQIKNKSDDSERLLMMTYFKLDRLNDADKVFRANIDNMEMFVIGIDFMILAGQSANALKYLETKTQLPPSMILAKARLLLAVDRDVEAKTLFEQLVSLNEYMYDAISGLYTIAEKQDKLKPFFVEYATIIQNSEHFDNKDALLAQFAANTESINEINLSIGFINHFISNYDNSPYLSDIYNTRAKLYRTTGRLENCVKDADRIIALGGSAAEDALFLKAECMEGVDMVQAVALYNDMAAEDNRFFQLATTRVTTLSDNATEVLQASIKLKDVSKDTYTKGVVRFVEMSSKEDYDNNKDTIMELSENSTGTVRSAVFWRIGKDHNDSKDYENAALSFMSGYYLEPKADYATKNLASAKQTYETRGMTEQAAKIDSIVVNMDNK